MNRLLSTLTLVILLGGSLLLTTRGQRSEAAPQSLETHFLPVTFAGARGALPPSPFGLQIYAPSGEASPYYHDQFLTGATWIRNPVHWDWIEPSNTTPANYYWPPADTALGGAADGFKLIGTLGILPSWAATDPYGRIDKVPLSEFTQFLGALVERFDGDGVADAPGSPKVDHWEMFNEPDAGERGELTSWGNYGADYAAMLAAAYPAIKAANPNAQVMFGGIAYDWFEPNGPFVFDFLPTVLSTGGCAHFDIMNFHAYPAFADNWAPYGPGLTEKTAAIRAVVQQHCGVDKPIAVTEAGWHSNVQPPFFDTTPQTQAHYVIQLFAQAKAAGLDSFIWWLLTDQMIGDEYPYKNGLVGELGEYKPAFTAYANGVAELTTATFVRTLPASETGAVDLEVHQLDDPVHKRTLYVAWVNPINTTTQRTLRLPAASLVKRTLYGVATVISDGADGVVDGLVTVQVGGAPIYLEIER